jgi:hypothetical protein
MAEEVREAEEAKILNRREKTFKYSYVSRYK